jgi:predicted ATPase/class 3 adenylate cyclase
MALPTGTVTLLFSDIVNSTRLWEQARDGMTVALERHDELLRTAIEHGDGVVFKTVGDAFCAVFQSEQLAVLAAIAIQRALLAESWPLDAPIQVRIALHTGTCQERGGDYFGPTVNRVARLEAVVHGGQVVMSRATADLILDSLPSGVTLRNLGEHRLKDLGRPEEVYQLCVDGLPMDFPSLRSLDNPELKNNLPIQLSSFVGRADVLLEVRAHVEVSRLVTLTGSGGCGKTRLALQVAAQLVDGSGGGVWFVDLAPLTDFESITPTLASVLGIRLNPGQALLQTIVEVVGERRLLLVLDNCEHLIEPCARIVDSLLRSCSQLHILSTSRVTFGLDGERIVRVASLSVPPQTFISGVVDLQQFESVQLLIERATAHNADFRVDSENAGAVATLCRRLDGIPLAIELAASRLRSMSVQDIEARLDDRFRLLTGGSRSSLPRQQTLAALVDWSYDLLTEAEKTVFRRFSVFVGGWNLRAAEVVCSDDDIAMYKVLDILDSLADRSLVQVESSGGNVRYRLLETIRQYATEKLSRCGDVEVETTRSRHAGYFLALAEEAKSHWETVHESEWMTVLESDHDNLHSAIVRLTDDSGEGEKALRLGGALYRYWMMRNHFSESATLLSAAIDRDNPEQHHHLRAGSICNLGFSQFHLGNLDVARIHFSEALDLARAHDNVKVNVRCHHGLSYLAFKEGDYDMAGSLADEAVELALMAGDGDDLAFARECRADVRSPFDANGARLDLEQALVHYETVGNVPMAIDTKLILGILELEAGNADTARECLEQAREYALSARNLYILQTALIYMGVSM